MLKQTIQTLGVAAIVVLLAACGGKTPEPNFSFNLDSNLAPAEITFHNDSKNANRYYWDFGDGTFSEEATPTHTFEYWGDYTVTLYAYNGDAVEISTKTVKLVEGPRRKVGIETSMGTMIVELSNLTPKHRDNFLKHAEANYYEGMLFHRVIDNFMIQGGDPDSKGAPFGSNLGQGGPGYTIEAEFRDGMFHYKGALAAARLGDSQNPAKSSSGSQFYIVDGTTQAVQQLQQVEQYLKFQYKPDERSYYEKMGGTPQLDKNYTVFGYVVEGLEVVDKISGVKTLKTQGDMDRPMEDVVIKRVYVVE